MEKNRIPWENASTYIMKEPSPCVLRDLDNDAATLQKERTVFERMLSKINPDITIVNIESEEDGTSNTFILNTVSVSYADAIIGLFKDNAVQYEVDRGLYAVPIEGGPSKSYTPMQRTMAIHRRALKKQKRSLLLTFFYTIVCIGVVSLLARLFYRIVLV